jgi:ATP-dependent RNA helicase RhlE
MFDSGLEPEASTQTTRHSRDRSLSQNFFGIVEQHFAALLLGRSPLKSSGISDPIALADQRLNICAGVRTSKDTFLKTFSELKLIAGLEKSLREQDYETPTPIQAQTIPHALEGKDILGCAQTGTGKTAAFSLPMLDYLGGEMVKAKRGKPQGLVLAPTRELAIQIGDSLKVYGKHLKLRTALIFGGVNQNNQVREMNRGVHIVVATPGRLIDLMNQGYVDLSELEIFVLDEADRMLDMGFLPDLKRIIKTLPDNRQSMFFSATMAPSIVELSKQLLFNPISVNVTPKEKNVKKIKQELIFVDRGDKPELLRDLVSGDEVDSAIVFTRTKRGANVVAKRLDKAGVDAAVIHGGKSQNARQRALADFRNGRVSVMVATDVAARGIDIDAVSHVVNYDLPNEAEAYVHRIGRTGRAGLEGTAISFCAGDELDYLREIEKLIGQQIPRDPDSVEPAYEPARKPGQNRGRGGGGNRRRSSQGSSSRSAGGSSSSSSRRGKPSSKRRSGSGGSSRSSSSTGGGRSGARTKASSGGSKAKRRPGKNARARTQAV